MADGFPEMSPTPPRGANGVTTPPITSINIDVNSMGTLATQAANAKTLQNLATVTSSAIKEIGTTLAEMRDMQMELFVLTQDAITRTAYYATRGIQEAQLVDQHIVDDLIPTHIANAVAAEANARIEGVNHTREQDAAAIAAESNARIEAINNTRDQVSAPYTAEHPKQLPFLNALTSGLTVDYPELGGAVTHLQTQMERLPADHSQQVTDTARQALDVVVGGLAAAPGLAHLVNQAIRTWIDYPAPSTVTDVMGSIGNRLNELDSQCTDLMNNGGRKMMKDNADLTGVAFLAALSAWAAEAIADPVGSANADNAVLQAAMEPGKLAFHALANL